MLPMYAADWCLKCLRHQSTALNLATAFHSYKALEALQSPNAEHQHPTAELLHTTENRLLAIRWAPGHFAYTSTRPNPMNIT